MFILHVDSINKVQRVSNFYIKKSCVIFNQQIEKYSSVKIMQTYKSIFLSKNRRYDSCDNYKNITESTKSEIKMNIVNLKNITKLVITMLCALIVTHEALSQDLEIENLAFEKPVWTDGGIGQGEPKLLTDGNTKSESYLGGPRVVEIDFEDPIEINTIRIWQFWADGRTYLNRKIAFDTKSGEKGGFKGKEIVVFNTIKAEKGKDKDEKETAEGRLITFDTIKAQYLRAWAGENTVNEWSHWVEIQAFLDPDLMQVTQANKLTTSWGQIKNR